jgi:hypothetical protein
MIAYEYQQLLLLPDLKSGEFVNVGFVIKCKESDDFTFSFVSSLKKIQHVFTLLNTKVIHQKIQSIEASLHSYKSKQKTVVFIGKWNSIQSITEMCLAKDDSALQFGEVKSGIDISLEIAAVSLKKRFLEKWNSQTSSNTLDDETIWRKQYKHYFKEKGIEDKLVEKSFTTKHDTLSFSHSYKNGVWNCFLPINLDLAKSDSIKKKAYSWVGKCDELIQTGRTIKIFFLASMPTIHQELYDFIESKLNIESSTLHCRLIKKPQELQPVFEELFHN